MYFELHTYHLLCLLTTINFFTSSLSVCKDTKYRPRFAVIRMWRNAHQEISIQLRWNYMYLMFGNISNRDNLKGFWQFLYINKWNFARIYPRFPLSLRPYSLIHCLSWFNFCTTLYVTSSVVPINIANTRLFSSYPQISNGSWMIMPSILSIDGGKRTVFLSMESNY